MVPQISRLLNTEPRTARQQLDRLSPEELVAPDTVVSPDEAHLVKAALYLKHGFLDECHKIAQQIDSTNGSYWHAIMHRLEGDFSNSKYWYRRVGRHPVFAQLGYDWDPFDFVDQCARGASAPIRAWEQEEFDALLEHTWACATGTRPAN